MEKQPNQAVIGFPTELSVRISIKRFSAVEFIIIDDIATTATERFLLHVVGERTKVRLV